MDKPLSNFYLVPMHDMTLEDIYLYYNDNRFQHEQNFDPGDLDFSIQSQRIRLLRSIIEADRKIAYRLSVISEDRKMIGVVKIAGVFDPHQFICDISYSVDKKLDGKGYNGLILNRATNLAFKEYGYRKATLTFLSTNETGIKTAQEVGYVIVGLMKKHEKIRGEWKDFILLEKLNQDIL
ncbi:MAG: ribosomal-protein-alanine N-acetyltransferase [Erysipelotrichaceae bacterium]|nr:MAG: ribosomal-protein-alanine [Erysipelotrichaceae bacterium]TXT18870.1 MAG: ribosomal-protein-alanine N-acetyltransferase [Erysipelotrichaceae bacterium]